MYSGTSNSPGGMCSSWKLLIYRHAGFSIYVLLAVSHLAPPRVPLTYGSVLVWYLMQAIPLVLASRRLRCRGGCSVAGFIPQQSRELRNFRRIVDCVLQYCSCL